MSIKKVLSFMFIPSGLWKMPINTVRNDTKQLKEILGTVYNSNNNFDYEGFSDENKYIRFKAKQLLKENPELTKDEATRYAEIHLQSVKNLDLSTYSKRKAVKKTLNQNVSVKSLPDLFVKFKKPPSLLEKNMNTVKRTSFSVLSIIPISLFVMDYVSNYSRATAILITLFLILLSLIVFFSKQREAYCIYKLKDHTLIDFFKGYFNDDTFYMFKHNTLDKDKVIDFFESNGGHGKWARLNYNKYNMIKR